MSAEQVERPTAMPPAGGWEWVEYAESLETHVKAAEQAISDQHRLLSDSFVRVEQAEAQLADLREASQLVVELDDRERFGDETLTGHEWGDAVRALRALLPPLPEEEK